MGVIVSRMDALEAMHPWPLPRPATRLRRCMGLVTDWVLLCAMGLCLGLLQTALLVKLHERHDFFSLLMSHPKSVWGSVVLWHVVMGLAAWGYFVALRAVCSRTCGEALWGLWLASGDGRVPGFMDCLHRGVGALISLLPLGLGFWWSMIDNQGQSWHDRLSRTCLAEFSPPGLSP